MRKEAGTEIRSAFCKMTEPFLQEGCFMETKVYGYVRVSSKDQNEERQVLAMRQFGIPDERIFIEKQSGKDFNRPVYLDLIRKLNPGDVLVIKIASMYKTEEGFRC